MAHGIVVDGSIFVFVFVVDGLMKSPIGGVCLWTARSFDGDRQFCCGLMIGK